MVARAPPQPRPKATPARAAPLLQAKLMVGPSNDRHEREAERVADSVMRGTPLAQASPPPVISAVTAQRAPAPAAPGPERREEDATPPEARAQRASASAVPAPPKEDDRPASKAQRDAATGSGPAGGAAPASVEASVQRMQRRPAPGLDAPTRRRMEGGIGRDLGDVRVHADRAAGQAASALGARAFTVGRDIFFGAGQYQPKTTAGQRLIAHEATHTLQQRGGSAAARRVQRAGEGAIKPDPGPEGEAAGPKKVTRLPVDPAAVKDWEVDLKPPGGGRPRILVPKLELPEVAGGLKGTAGSKAGAKREGDRPLPAAGQTYTLDPPVPERPDLAPFEAWVAHVRKTYSPGLESKLKDQLDADKGAASIERGGVPVYVLYTGGKKAASAKTIILGSVKELSEHDSLVRPMLGPKGGDAKVDADHALELQIDGLDGAENLWLLESGYNRSVGPSIKGKINAQITETLKTANSTLAAEKGTELDGTLPNNATVVKRDWIVSFKTVAKGGYGTTNTFWTQADIEKGVHLPYFKAMTEKELIDQGFVFKEGVVPSTITVFPDKAGGRAIRFKVSKDGKTIEPPGFFFRGIKILSVGALTLPDAKNRNGPMFSLSIARYTEQAEDPPLLKVDWGELVVRNDEALGYGGYVSRDSVRAALNKGETQFFFLSPVSFADAQISPDGDLVASGSILSSKALFPGLQVPILLRGPDILMQFPIPTENLSFGPVQVTEAALEVGVGAKGFFLQGSAGIAVDQVGRGTLTARAEKNDIVIAGNFLLDLDFLEKAEVAASYSLLKDEFTGSATIAVKKDSLPGVDSGSVTVTLSRDSFGLTGSLMLGGILAGSTITVGYTPDTGLLIEGKDIPLPVDKLPGVSDAKVTVRAIRSPETGAWTISGGGKASLSAGGATGSLDVMFDGQAVTLNGRATVKKGPASGWLDVTATNRATDEKGNPIEGGPVGDLHIWGKGEASIAFGKVLTGTAGIEYTPEGSVIISGEIALPPTVDLFEKKSWDKSLLSVSTPDFPIWGVKLGPVGVGIFAYADAEIRFSAYVGPGQLRDTKVKATMDLDKPEEATVEGGATFFVPAFAGLTLDIGGGLKAQVAVAYVKGRVGLDGTLGVAADGSFGVTVKWNPTDGLAAEAVAKINAKPKFELGINASVFAGVDLGLTTIEKEWGPWRESLGEFGPDMELGVTFPVKWSEKDGLDLSLDNIEVKKPSLDATGLIKSAFDTLV